MSAFALNKDIFNPALYKEVQKVWFQDYTPDKQTIDYDIVKKWFGASPDERHAFDATCRASFAHALDAIGPDKFPNASAEPFLREIHDAVQRSPENDGAEAAWTALSLALLLDQMPRNIFRTHDGLVKVYTHYDKIAYSLITALMSTSTPIVRPDLHPQWRLSASHRLWFYLPLVHSEDVEAHKKYDEIIREFKKDLETVEGYEGSKKFLERATQSGIEHRELIDRFGRYPHRNGALGRTSTEDEKKYMAAGGMTFGVAQEE